MAVLRIAARKIRTERTACPILPAGGSRLSAPRGFFAYIGRKGPLSVGIFCFRRRGNRCKQPLPGWAPSLRVTEAGQSGKCRHLDCPPFLFRNSFLLLSLCRGRHVSPFSRREGMARGGQARSGAVPEKISTRWVVFTPLVFGKPCRIVSLLAGIMRHQKAKHTARDRRRNE